MAAGFAASFAGDVSGVGAAFSSVLGNGVAFVGGVPAGGVPAGGVPTGAPFAGVLSGDVPGTAGSSVVLVSGSVPTPLAGCVSPVGGRVVAGSVVVAPDGSFPAMADSSTAGGWNNVNFPAMAT